MRFPFMLPGVTSLVLSVWITLSFLIRQPEGPFGGGIEVAMVVMIAFGCSVVRRHPAGREPG